MPYDLNELTAFAAVVGANSFTGAGRRLGLPKATVSRRVSALEARLGVRLLQRTTRRMAVTEVGQLLYEHCRRIAAEIEGAEVSIGGFRTAPRGVLTVAGPPTIMRVLVGPLLPDFLLAHPDVRVVLRVAPEAKDPVAQRADVIVTGRPVPISSYPVRVLLRTPTFLFASPRYLARRREPQMPADLAAHPALVMSLGARDARPGWTLHAGERRESVALEPVLLSSDVAPLVEAACAGLGILLTSPTVVVDEVSAARLVRVMSRWEGPTVEARAIYASRRALAPKVRVFIDYLARRLSSSSLPSSPAR